MYIKYFLLWLPMVILAFINAGIRQTVFIKYFDELRAHQLSTVTLIIFCSIYVWFIFPMLKVQSAGQAFAIGLMWAVLTIIFEFSLGMILKRPLSVLLQNNNIFSGHIWPLFILSLFFLPYLYFILRK